MAHTPRGNVFIPEDDSELGTSIDPDHRRKVRKSKAFEVITVMVLIIGGVILFGMLGRVTDMDPDREVTLEGVKRHLDHEGFRAAGESTVLDRRFLTYEQRLESFAATVDVMAPAEGETVDLIILAISQPQGQDVPPVEEAESALTKAVAKLSHVAQMLIPASADGFTQAVETTKAIKDEGVRPHDRGTAGTNSNWKVTYIVYHEYPEDGEAVPLMLFVCQSLDSASSPDFEQFNRALFGAINTGDDLKTTLQSLS